MSKHFSFVTGKGLATDRDATRFVREPAAARAPWPARKGEPVVRPFPDVEADDLILRATVEALRRAGVR
jgi:hypothetical protein